jgi:zinc ribbon protein
MTDSTDPLKFLSGLSGVGEPKLSSGETIAPEAADTELPVTPSRAVVKRKRGQEPEVKTVETSVSSCCPQGHSVKTGMKFCPECGSGCVAAGPLRCRNGHEVPEGDKFCSSCGTPLSGEAHEKLLSEESQVSKEEAHRRAISLGQENPVTAYTPGQAPGGTETVLIHFLADGFTAFGNVWMRGQEIELWPGHPRWREAQGWITLDVSGQYARYGRQMFGSGPWPGAKSYTQGAGHFQQLGQLSGQGVVSQPTEEELARADAKEKQRGRRVPMPMG